jgi:hypothetical protein
MKVAADKSTLDRHVVNLFSHKAVLAVLMMYCVEEFKGFSAEYIMEHCFVGEVSVRELPVDRDVPPDPDVKDLPYDDLGGLMENESVSLREGSLLDGNEKVYSIWICPYARNGENTVTTYEIRENKVFGSSNTPREDYDKLETVVITLNEDGLQSENELIRYLSLLLNKEMPVEQREKELERDYHLQMTEDVRKDVGKMCNYSEAIWMQGIEKGIAQGETNGSIKTAAEFVRNKLVSIKDAAKQLGMTEEDFCEKAGIQKEQ